MFSCRTSIRHCGFFLALSAISAGRTLAFRSMVPSNFSLRRCFGDSRTMVQMSSSDDELQRLKAENELLRKKLQLREENEQLRKNIHDDESVKSNSGSLIDSFTGAFSKALRPLSNMLKPKKQDTQVDSLVDQLFSSAPLLPFRAFSGLVKGVAGLASESFKAASTDIERVKSETILVLMKDPIVKSELGTDLRLDPPFSQSFSSASINGRTTKRVSLQMSTQGSKSAGIVAVDANIDEQNKVAISRCSVQVGGRIIKVSNGNSFRSDRSNDVIDVEAR